MIIDIDITHVPVLTKTFTRSVYCHQGVLLLVYGGSNAISLIIGMNYGSTYYLPYDFLVHQFEHIAAYVPEQCI